MSGSGRSKADFWSGTVLIAGPLLSVFAMTHHPTAHGATAADRLDSMVRFATLGAWVHGVLIALMIAIFLALTALAGRLGWRDARVRAGAVVYFVGVLCMLGAALVSGFLVLGLAERYADASPAEIEAAAPVFHLAHEANQALAKAGAVAMSAGILFWSWVMVSRPGWPRWVGAFGLAAGLLPILGLAAGALHLDVHGMLAVVAAQALWQIGVGVWLTRSA